ncbi:hypothetical protein M231_00898 [Tremella mesenterica]|uniref:Uncharacterized protein n=1 Tax=Tremella mesenterica TaxID=5217 RepID=A0A4Q1BUT7_TREME|nr:hypothetical protein M231_00898 [Tremella mesenterica]
MNQDDFSKLLQSLLKTPSGINNTPVEPPSTNSSSNEHASEAPLTLSTYSRVDTSNVASIDPSLTGENGSHSNNSTDPSESTALVPYHQPQETLSNPNHSTRESVIKESTKRFSSSLVLSFETVMESIRSLHEIIQVNLTSQPLFPSESAPRNVKTLELSKNWLGLIHTLRTRGLIRTYVGTTVFLHAVPVLLRFTEDLIKEVQKGTGYMFSEELKRGVKRFRNGRLLFEGTLKLAQRVLAENAAISVQVSLCDEEGRLLCFAND